jgi:hypothetical protein
VWPNPGKDLLQWDKDEVCTVQPVPLTKLHYERWKL